MHWSSLEKTPSTPSISVMMKTFLGLLLWAIADAAIVSSNTTTSPHRLRFSLF